MSSGVGGYIDEAVGSVLANSQVLMGHPGGNLLSEEYANPSNCVSRLAPAVTFRGQFRVQTNSRICPGRSDFPVSTSSIFDTPYLIVEIPDNWNWGVTQDISDGVSADKFLVTAIHDGWLFKAIESLEITCSNSLIQSMTIYGESLQEIILNQCNSNELREAIIKMAGTQTSRIAVLPLTFLNFHVLNMHAAFPQDGSILAGPYQISVNWRTPNYWSLSPSGADSLLSPGIFQWKTCQLIFKTINLINSAFGVKRAMQMNPQLVLSNPAKYYQKTEELKNLIPGPTITTINLNSAPSGMLLGMFVTVYPRDQLKDNPNSEVMGGNQPKMFNGFDITSLKLTFGGQDLIRFDNPLEKAIFYAGEMEEPDNYCVDIAIRPISKRVEAYSGASISNAAIAPLITTQCQSKWFPLMVNQKAVMRGRLTENLASYGGSQLQLSLSIDYPRVSREWRGSDNNVLSPVYRATGVPAADYYYDTLHTKPICFPAAPTLITGNYYDSGSPLPFPTAPPDGIPCVITVTYVIATLLEQANGVADLQF